MLDYLIRQFGHPRGPVGALAGFVMATRLSNRARNAWAVSLLDAVESTHVLEIGCGPGLALETLSRAAPQAHLVGVDHSVLMVAHARRRVTVPQEQ